MGGARNIASGTSDASSLGERLTFSRYDLEHGADVRSWEQQTAGRQANDGDDTIAGIQEHRVDGEPHPEGVDRPAAPKQHPLVGSDLVSSAEAARPFTHRLRDVHGEVTESLAPHAATLAWCSDAGHQFQAARWRGAQRAARKTSR